MLRRERNKLDLKTMGPFVVIENHGHTLDIDVNGIPECIASDRVRSAPGNIEQHEPVNRHTDSVKEDTSTTLAEKKYLCRGRNPDLGEF